MNRSERLVGLLAPVWPELGMTVARSVADVLSEHVAFEVESIDRMYLNVYVPQLQHVGGVVWFFRGHRGATFASSALMDPISRQFVAAVHRFARDRQLPWVDFAKGERKDDVARRLLAGYTRADGVLFVGRAQEKTATYRTERRRNPDTGIAYPWIVRGTAMVNHFYFYCVDDDFGPFFLKFSSYFPYTAKLCINGNEWAKRQAAKAGLNFTPLDNGFAAVDDPAALQAICDRLGPADIDALLCKWLAILPHPFTPADRAAGYRYQLSVLQAEFSLTQMLDRPLSGRVFFEEVIRENLDVGRPDKVSLIFDRRAGRRTPSVFRTRVLTDTVTPSLHVDYKHSKVKQYHKESRALRTETTINDTYDFGVNKGLAHLPALREIGFSANRRLLRVEQLSHDPIHGEQVFTQVTAPVQAGSQRAAGLRFDQPHTQALLSTLVVFRLLPRGFTNADLRRHLTGLLGLLPDGISPGRMTYDLRRLRLHQLIERIPGSHRYQVTDLGWRTALLLTRTYTRLLRPGLAHLTAPPEPAGPGAATVRRRLDQLDAAIHDYARKAKLAA
jgi:hypothetical protein